MARLLTEAVDKYGHAGYLAEIFGLDFLDEVKKPNSDRVRNWHQSLCEFIGGNNSITAFHLMMDLGLPCVKPDIVLTDLFYRLGWLSEAGLPRGTSRAEIRGHYLSPGVYWSVQRAALDLASGVKPLFGPNAIREVGWVMVKYGQEPEPRRGICRNLDKEDPDRLTAL